MDCVETIGTYLQLQRRDAVQKLLYLLLERFDTSIVDSLRLHPRSFSGPLLALITKLRTLTSPKEYGYSGLVGTIRVHSQWTRFFGSSRILFGHFGLSWFWRRRYGPPVLDAPVLIRGYDGTIIVESGGKEGTMRLCA